MRRWRAVAAAVLVALGALAVFTSRPVPQEPPAVVWMRAAPPSATGQVVAGDEVRAAFDGPWLAFDVVSNAARTVDLAPRPSVVERCMEALGASREEPYWMATYEVEPVIAQSAGPWRQLRLTGVTRQTSPLNASTFTRVAAPVGAPAVGTPR